jgi:hypothetical protein
VGITRPEITGINGSVTCNFKLLKSVAVPQKAAIFSYFSSILKIKMQDIFNDLKSARKY